MDCIGYKERIARPITSASDYSDKNTPDKISGVFCVLYTTLTGETGINIYIFIYNTYILLLFTIIQLFQIFLIEISNNFS